MALPTQTKFIVGNEACERFSFYGMRSILTLYMVNVLAMPESEAVEVAHLFNAGIYILPLLGAWIADRFWGRYNTILYVSLFYCLGHGVLALADCVNTVEARQLVLFIGLFIIALGAGGIKPCVSAFVGDQVEEGGKNDGSAMTRVYAAFYWSINLGSFFSFLIIPWVRQAWGYGWAFAIPGGAMAAATFIFWMGRKQYRHRQPTQPHFLSALLTRIFRGKQAAANKYGSAIEQQSTRTAIGILAFIVVAPLIIALVYGAKNGGQTLAELSGAPRTAASLIGLACMILCIIALALSALRLAASLRLSNFFGIVGSMLYMPGKEWKTIYTPRQGKEARNMLRVLTVFLLIIPFWSLYDQTMSSWVLQGEKMQALQFSLFGTNLRFGAEEMQSFNPLLVMIFVPAITLVVYPRIGKWSAPLKRMGIGIILAGASYGAVALIQQSLDSGEKLTILWQCIPYLMLTVSEILVSTTGIEYAYTAAGKHLKSTVSSFWYLTSTCGNCLVIYMTTLVSDPASVSTFLLYGALSVLIGIIFIIVTTRPKFQAEL